MKKIFILTGEPSGDKLASEVIKQIKLKENNINLNISYPYPIHSMPPFKKFKKTNMKNTNLLSKEIFSLPMYPALSIEKVEKTIHTIKKFI